MLNRERRKLRDTFVADNGQKLADAERQVDDLEQRLTKAQARTEYMTLRSPPCGNGASFISHDYWQVVMPGEELMRIVPDGSVLEVEAYLPNRDIGFVQAGKRRRSRSNLFPSHATDDYRPRDSSGERCDPEPEAQQAEANPAKSTRISGCRAARNVRKILFFLLLFVLKRQRLPRMACTYRFHRAWRSLSKLRLDDAVFSEYLFSPFAEVASRAMHER